ncbi:MAG: XrtA system polysaccharide deacetylase [Nitrospirota bacterium]
MMNALTVDVEDYFHVAAFEHCIDRQTWDRYPLRVADNTMRILRMLEDYPVKATFFILGWVAERCPGLVKEIQRHGHEIACHGYGHQLIYRIGPKRFRSDIRRSKRFLEDISGTPVYGYRAPSYSITKNSLWAFDILVEEGFRYDSSVFPIVHDIYGIPNAKRFPHTIHTASGNIREFPLSTIKMGGSGITLCIPVAGGGYLRLFPAWFIKQAIFRINEIEEQPAVLYFHPWELDPEQPRIKAGFKSCFRHYLNIHRMETRIREIVPSFSFDTMHAVLGISTEEAPIQYGVPEQIHAA